MNEKVAYLQETVIGYEKEISGKPFREDFLEKKYALYKQVVNLFYNGFKENGIYVKKEFCRKDFNINNNNFWKNIKPTRKEDKIIKDRYGKDIIVQKYYYSQEVMVAALMEFREQLEFELKIMNGQRKMKIYKLACEIDDKQEEVRHLKEFVRKNRFRLFY